MTKKSLIRRVFIALVALTFLTGAADITDAEKQAIEESLEIELAKLKIIVGGLGDTVNQVSNNQLNYKIEKDLLKETYSKNYESVNMMITIVLGVFGVLGYLGIRDVGSIKKEYEKELSVLKELKAEFDTKSKKFDEETSSINAEIRSLLKENKEQNEKLKLIELKDKALTHMKNENNGGALEFSNAALSIDPENIECLNIKATALMRLNELSEAVSTLREAMECDPKRELTILNSVECLFFAGQIEEAKQLMSVHNNLISSRADGKLKELFWVIEAYHKQDEDGLKTMINKYLNEESLHERTKAMGRDWSLTEARYFAHHIKNDRFRFLLGNLFDYWDGRTTGETLARRVGITPKEC